MKIAIVGCGAIGGYVGVRLALAGETVTCLVRGANLTAIRAGGLKLIHSDGTEEVARNRHRDPGLQCRGRAGRRDPVRQGAPGGSGGERCAATVRA